MTTEQGTRAARTLTVGLDTHEIVKWLLTMKRVPHGSGVARQRHLRVHGLGQLATLHSTLWVSELDADPIGRRQICPRYLGYF